MVLNVRGRKKTFAIAHLLNFLEDPRYPSVGPHLRLLGLTGLWRPKNTNHNQMKQYLFYITILFFFSQYLKCVIKFHPDALKLILQYAPFHLGIVKACFFRKDYQKWASVIDYISTVERKEQAEGNEEKNQIIDEYIKRSRRMTYFFWSLAFFSNFTIFSEPYLKNQTNVNGTTVYMNIFDGYTPFNENPPGYYFSLLIQTVLGHIVSAYVVGWDTLVCTVMIFLSGQLKITRLNCTKVIDVNNVQRSHENIAECHRFHITLVK